MSLNSKKKKIRIISTVIGSFVLIITAFYFFQQRQYVQTKLELPDSHLMVIKIDNPLELEVNNKE